MPCSASTSPRAGTRPLACALLDFTPPERYVIKIGGSLGANGLSVCAEIRELLDGGSSVAIVHGGGAQADRLAHELGRPPRHLTSTAGRRSRYTDAAALDA